MLNYREEQMQEIITDILQDREVKVRPMGNHHLKRHLVYKVDSRTMGEFTFKLYYRDRRRSREVASLSALEGSNVKCPRIVKKGVLESGFEWLMLEYKQGMVFDSVIKEIAPSELLGIFEQIGEELAKLHSYKVFEFFGEWDENGVSLRRTRDYSSHFIQGVEGCIKNIEAQELPDKELLCRAVAALRNSYQLFDFKLVPRMTHHDFDGRNIIVKREKSLWKVQAVIDFEGCSPGNSEMDLVQLYKRYFLKNKEYEKSFLKGYTRFHSVDSTFYKRLPIYLLEFAVSNCSWAYTQAPDYYFENIELIRQRL